MKNEHHIDLFLQLQKLGPVIAQMLENDHSNAVRIKLETLRASSQETIDTLLRHAEPARDTVLGNYLFERTRFRRMSVKLALSPLEADALHRADRRLQHLRQKLNATESE